MPVQDRKVAVQDRKVAVSDTKVVVSDTTVVVQDKTRPSRTGRSVPIGPGRAPTRSCDHPSASDPAAALSHLADMGRCDDT